MTGSRLRALLIALLMAASFAGAAAWRPSGRLADSMPPIDLEQLFPKTFGEWTVDDRMPVQLVSPDQKAVLDKIYNQTVSRTYVDGRGDRVMLSVAYGGDQSDATRAHRPEVCYPAQGFQILSQVRGDITLGTRSAASKQLVAKLGGRIEPITYWVMVGDQVATSGTEQKLAQLRYTTRGLVPDGMLVRVSSIDVDSQRSFKLQQRFLTALQASIDPSQRHRVFGR